MGPCNRTWQNNIIPLIGEAGKLFSPLYPRKSSLSISCTWVITVPEGHFVRLRIKDIELDQGCHIKLHIRDGNSSSDDLLKSTCDWRLRSSAFGSVEHSMFSSGRFLWVQFDSLRYHASYSSKFDAVYEAVKQGEVILRLENQRAAYIDIHTFNSSRVRNSNLDKIKLKNKKHQRIFN